MMRQQGWRPATILWADGGPTLYAFWVDVDFKRVVVLHIRLCMRTQSTGTLSCTAASCDGQGPHIRFPESNIP